MQMIFWLVCIIVFFIFLCPSFKNSIDTKVTIPQRALTRELNKINKVLLYGYFVAFSCACVTTTFELLYYKGLLISGIFFLKNIWVPSFLVVVCQAIYKKTRTLSVILAGVSVFLFFYLDIGKVDGLGYDYAIVLSIFIGLFVFAVLYPLISWPIAKKRKLKRGVWRDLYYRTTNVIFDYTDWLELSKILEELYNNFLYYAKRIKKVNSIEFVTLRGVRSDEGEAEDYWYKKASTASKIFIALCLFYNLGRLLLYKEIYNIICIVEIAIFLIIIYYIKKIDYNYLKLIGIRYFYDDWGYYFLSEKKDEFVSLGQMFHVSKYKFYVKSMLDMLAVFRYAQQIDKVKGTSMIKYISQELIEIAETVGEIDDWKGLLPVWIISYLQYEKTNDLSREVKQFLYSNVIGKKQRANVSIAMQSILADYYRKIPTSEDRQKLKCFMDCIMA